jgi:hypothetical protein
MDLTFFIGVETLDESRAFGNDADFEGGAIHVGQAPKDTEKFFAAMQTKSPFCSGAVVAEFSDARRKNFEPRIADQVTECLHIPGIKVVIRFVGIESAIAMFLFEWHMEKKFSPETKKAMDLSEHVGRLRHMFEDVMANNSVERFVRKFGRRWKKLDVGFFEIWAQEIFKVTGHPAGALEFSEIPAQTSAEFEDCVGCADMRLEFFCP